MSKETSRIPELFGSCVFNEETMAQYVPKGTMDAWRSSLQNGKPLSLEAANNIADGMKTWALEHGATHFTHWFQPMTGFTAEKHDSFISPVGGGRVIMDFSGKELVRGEPDASSFPSGGLRATFEARGYTAWDPTSFAFIKDNSLYIPTVFCSYSGEALDKKTPLLRSMEAVSRQALRVLRLFGDTTSTKVTPQVGPEQEYFLVDRTLYYEARGSAPLRPHALRREAAQGPGARRPLLRLHPSARHGLHAGSRRGAVEARHLLQDPSTTRSPRPSTRWRPIYCDANTACDHNQLTMEVMKKVADRHGLVCLLHEKPFAGVNGSGKHNNWSLSTDTGKNLFAPGKTPSQNAQFLLFLTAFIQGVDEYQELLRSTVAFAGNDHRLGAQEAPPAIISIFLGDELMDIIESILGDTSYVERGKRSLRIGVDVLPTIPQDTTDRNRTSPVRLHRQQVRVPHAGLQPVHRRPEHRRSTRSWPRSSAASPTGSRPRRTSRRICTRSSRNPSPRTAASSSTATATKTAGSPRPKSAVLPTCAARPRPCPPSCSTRTWSCSRSTAF
jgi:glutamine synthetase